MGSSEAKNIVTTLLLVLCFLSHAESSSEKHKLLTWIEENSDVFVMLMHWKDLPLISTAWKRLKMTPQVQEDRKIFLESVSSFFEDQMQRKSKNTNQSSSSSSNDPTFKVNITSEETISLLNNATSRGDVDKVNLELQSNSNLATDSNMTQDNSNLTATNQQPVSQENTTSFRNRSLLNPPCNCSGKKSKHIQAFRSNKIKGFVCF